MGTSTLGSRFDDVIANGVANQSGNGVAIEPTHDIGAVGFGGFDTESQRESHFLAAFSFRKELHDFTLPARETK